MKGIIFDLDGTLWDSRETVAQSWNQAIRENSDLKIELEPEKLGALFGRPMEEIFANVFPDCEERERKRLETCCGEYEIRMLYSKPGIVYEGVEEVLSRLFEKYPLFVVSNCQDGYIQAFWQSTNLGRFFKDGLCPDDTGELKAENIRRIMEKHGISEAVYVGDTQGDAEACRQAKVPMIYAAYGLGEAQEYAGKIMTFRQLPEELKRIGFSV